MGILLHKFAYFKGLRLFFLSNFPEATFIQGVTSIPDSKVATKDNWKLQDYFCQIFHRLHLFKGLRLFRTLE